MWRMPPSMPPDRFIASASIAAGRTANAVLSCSESGRNGSGAIMTAIMSPLAVKQQFDGDTIGVFDEELRETQQGHNPLGEDDAFGVQALANDIDFGCG